MGSRKLRTIATKIPHPLKQCWASLGWLDDHLGRVVLLVFAIGLIVTGAAAVIGYISDMPIFWVYVGTIVVLVFSIWGAVGVAALVRVPNVGEKVTSDVPAKTENKVARLHITPLAVGGRAILRVENEGPSVSVAARLERVGNLDIDALPYRMKWKDDEQTLSHLLPAKAELNQRTVGVGETDTVIVAEGVYGGTVLPMPGGINWPSKASGCRSLRNRNNDTYFTTNGL